MPSTKAVQAFASFESRAWSSGRTMPSVKEPPTPKAISGMKRYGIAGRRAIAKIPYREVVANRAIRRRRSFFRLMKPASGFAVMNSAVKLARSTAASAPLMPRSIYIGAVQAIRPKNRKLLSAK
jgi:hypothetical protein